MNIKPKTCPLNELGMSLSIPFNHSDDYAEAVRPYLPWVHDIYLAPPADIANTLKPFDDDPVSYSKKIQELQTLASTNGVVLSWVLNAPGLLGNLDSIIGFFEQLLLSGLTVTTTVAELEVAEKIHEALAEVEIASSLASNITNREQAENWIHRAGASIIHPDKSLIRRPERLYEIKSLGVKIKLIINNRCVINSPYCEQHRACALLNETRIQTDIAISKACGRIAKAEPWKIAPLAIPPAALPRLKGLVDIVKLDGRNWPTGRILQDIKNTLDLDSWAMFPWFVEPREAFDQLSKCDWNCESCGWCPSHFWFYAPEANDGPRLMRQFQPMEPFADEQSISPAGALGWLLKSSTEFGLRPIALCPVENGQGLDVDFSFMDAGVFRFRFMRLDNCSNERDFFSCTNRLGITYLFDQAQAPKGILEAIEHLSHEIQKAESIGIKTRKSPPPLIDQLDIGGFCIQDCLFCTEAQPRPTERSPIADRKLVHPLQTASFKKLIISQKAAMRAGRPRVLEFVGQDPASRWDLIQLIQTAKQAGYNTIITRGPGNSFSSRGWVAKLARAGLTGAQVSILSSKAEHHDDLTGRKGSFDEALSGISKLRRYGLDVQLGITCIDSSLAELAEIMDLVKPSAVSLFNLLHPGRISDSELVLFEHLLEYIRKAEKKLRTSSLRRKKIELHLFGFPRCHAQEISRVWNGKTIVRDSLPPQHNSQMGFLPECKNCSSKKWCIGIPSWQKEKYPKLHDLSN